jgi:NADH-quinone oxidoreductase subunit K
MFYITQNFFIFFPVFYLFFIGLLGVFIVRRSLIIVLLSIELLLLAVNLNFILFSCLNNDVYGQLFSFFILTVAAAEAAIGLSLLVIFFRTKFIISVDTISILKG